MHPELAPIGDEQVWQSTMVAVLNDGVWEITNKVKTGEIGGALFIYISEKDGRVVGIYLTQ